MLDVLEIIKNVETIYSANSSLNILKDFERVLDEMDMYVYKNWEDGELVEGPVVERHWVKASFMWPKDKMPDPMAAKRLTDYGCKVGYKQTNLVEPRQIKTHDDLRPGTQKGKLDRKPIWIVEITMPKKLVGDIFNGYMSKMKEEMGIKQDSSTATPPAQTADSAQVAAPAEAVPTTGETNAPV
jgi:hypothetical protein